MSRLYFSAHHSHKRPGKFPTVSTETCRLASTTKPELASRTYFRLVDQMQQGLAAEAPTRNVIGLTNKVRWVLARWGVHAGIVLPPLLAPQEPILDSTVNHSKTIFHHRGHLQVSAKGVPGIPFYHRDL